jgi:hypothetical protein
VNEPSESHSTPDGTKVLSLTAEAWQWGSEWGFRWSIHLALARARVSLSGGDPARKEVFFGGGKNEDRDHGVPTLRVL